MLLHAYDLTIGDDEDHLKREPIRTGGQLALMGNVDGDGAIVDGRLAVQNQASPPGRNALGGRSQTRFKLRPRPDPVLWHRRVVANLDVLAEEPLHPGATQKLIAGEHNDQSVSDGLQVLHGRDYRSSHRSGASSESS